jgi:hypothetical protein
VPEFIDPVFAKTSQRRSFLVIEAFWACFHENWVYKFGHCSLLKTYWESTTVDNEQNISILQAKGTKMWGKPCGFYGPVPDSFKKL